MGEVDRLGHAAHNLRGQPHADMVLIFNPFGQRGAFDEFERDERNHLNFAGLIHLDDTALLE